MTDGKRLDPILPQPVKKKHNCIERNRMWTNYLLLKSACTFFVTSIKTLILLLIYTSCTQFCNTTCNFFHVTFFFSISPFLFCHIVSHKFIACGYYSFFSCTIFWFETSSTPLKCNRTKKVILISFSMLFY